MFIEPIKPINGLNDISKSININDNKENEGMFKSMFDNALKDYVQAENKVDEDIKDLAAGKTDNLHDLMINTKKAELSLDLVIQLRNKALDAYNEIMRMGV